MVKKVIISGLMGGVVIVIWMIVVNGIFRLSANIEMKRIAQEQEVYDMLKEHISEPGRYTCGPQITPERGFPEGEPVFSILYGGIGHEAAGGIMLLQLVIFFVVTIISAWMLSKAHETVLSSYWQKVGFFVSLGLIISLFSEMTKYNIGSYPLADTILLALHNLVLWTLLGMVVAWRMK